MEITITRENIQEYSNGIFPDITEIWWFVGELNSVITNFPNLSKLYCNNNRLKTLEPLANLTNLRKLYCCSNQITTLEPLSNLINLDTLYCWNNQITTLEPLSNLTNLRELDCSDNQITTLEPLSNLTNLRDLYCRNNRLTTLEPLIYLRNLRVPDYLGNPLEVQTVQVQRFLNRLRSINSSIYNDNQNIHDVTIQKTVCDSIRNLLRDPKPVFSIDDIINSDLNKYTIEAITEYCQDESIHSVHLITYQELFSYIWQRITKTDHKVELMKILEEQIHDSDCKCFTGRFNRTLSVLVGFFEDININISDNSRIGAIILNLRDKIIPYNIDSYKQTARRELIELGYNEAEIEPWIDAIDDY